MFVCFQGTVHLQCTLYTVHLQCTLYTVHCTLYKGLYTYSVHRPKFKWLSIYRVATGPFKYAWIFYHPLNVVGVQATGCPKKQFSDEFDIVFLWISIVLPNFKSRNIIMSVRVYFMKRVKDCKDVSLMSLQYEQWRLTSLLCLYTAIFLFY